MAKCDCFSGTPGDKNYQPAGSVNRLHNFEVYQVATSSGDSKGELLILPDGFGLAKHNMILADHLSTHGYNVSILDYYQGKALPEALMDYVPGTDLDSYDQFTEEEKNAIRGVDLRKWSEEVNPDRIHELVVPFVEKLKANLQPATKLHILGHCFGGRQAFELAAHEQLITSIVIMHPAPYELKDVKSFKVPLFIGLAENDMFAPAATKNLPEAMKDADVYYKFAIYGGTQHGFASRSDPRDETARKAYRSSARDTIDWISQFTN